MGYKPKYARKGKKDIVREENLIQKPVKPVPEKKKKSKAVMALFLLLGMVIVPASTYATGKILEAMALDIGRPKLSHISAVQSMDAVAGFEEKVGQKTEAIRLALASGEKPQLPAVTEPEPVQTVVHLDYEIPEGTLVAPEPDQSKFGQTDSPDVLKALLEDAAWMLEGQQTYFQPDQQLYEGSKVRYFFDESMLAITWQEVHDGSVYTFSEVKVRHPSQFRRHLAGGEYGSDLQYLTTEMAASVNAVVASAGDFYRFRDFGAVVYEGQAKRVEGTYAETCYIDSQGDMHFTYGGEVLTTADVQAFVDAKDIEFSLAFGPVLVDDYQEVEHTWYGVGEINEGYARAALCQMGQLHYIVVTANTTGRYQEIPTVAQFRKNILATGCRMAYCLDGGQTATIVMNDELINRPVYGQQRKISDIIYFATAVPEGVEGIG